jgi:hypothetical protein
MINIMTKDKALKMALEALANGKKVREGEGGTKSQPALEDAAISAIEEALAQPEQEPWCMTMNGCKTKCEDCPDTITAIQEALAQPEQEQEQEQEQEPVAFQNKSLYSELISAEDWENIDPVWYWMYRPLYTSPPKLRIAAQAGLDRLNSIVVHWGLRKSDNGVNSTVGNIFTTIEQLESALAQYDAN